MSTHHDGSFNIEETLVPCREYIVISLHPIWAWAVLFAGKDVENRSWLTNQRGRVLIHASSHKMSIREDQQLRAAVSFLSGIPRSELPMTFARSAIMGSVEIADCVKNARSKWAAHGTYHWLLEAPRSLAAPIGDVHGKLQFWRWTSPAAATPQRTPASPARSVASRARVSDEHARESAAAAPTRKAAFDLSMLEPDAVMAALRKVASSKPANEVDVMRAVGRQLGCARLGSRVRTELKAQLRTAMRRGVLAREGKELRLATSSVADYPRDALIAAITTVVRKGQVVSKAEVAAAVARRLGFVEMEDLSALMAAIDAAIAAGSFRREGNERVRRVA